MKFTKSFLIAFAAIALLSGPVLAQNVPNYVDQGGATTHIGGVLELMSGGTLKADAGSLIDTNPPFSTGALTNPALKVARGTASLAQINTGGFQVLAPLTGRTIYIHSITARAIGGAFGGCTTVAFTDTAGSPASVLSWAIAALTSGTTVTSAAGTIGTAYAPESLTASQGLQLGKTGSSCTTATGLDYEITYAVQ